MVDAPGAPEHGRDALLASDDRRGLDLVAACTDATDGWLATLFARAAPDPAGLCLVAVGGYGRRELCPGSDIDVVLLHEGRRDLAEVAEALWYPVWDAGIKLGHAVRTPREALRLVPEDLDTATSLLSARPVAGDGHLAAALAEQAAALWRKRARRWLPELRERVEARQQAHGEVAFLLEPDLKEGRGGLRDVHALWWAHEAALVTFEEERVALRGPHDLLLAARAELHRHTGRPGDVLLLQEQDVVAAALGVGDADALMAALAAAAREVAGTTDEAWGAISRTLAGARRWRSARDRPLAPGLVLRDGEVDLASGSAVGDDPALVLRAAQAAAHRGTTIARGALAHLADEAAPFPYPWPAEAREALVGTLAAGPAAIPVLESLDRRGLLVRILPEWEPVRSRPQRNAYHRFTVDRHLLETAAEASALTGRVERPDLLLVAALLHDLGKGYPGDHTEAGVALMQRIAPRLGFSPADVEVLVLLVREHLLLPDVATRRDLADEATLRHVAERVGDRSTLRLLAALTEADSRATGPAAWSDWKAELVGDLVARTAHVLSGGDVAAVTGATIVTEEQLALLAAGQPRLLAEDDRLTVVWEDRPGLLSRVTGVLALHGLDVLDASVHSDDRGMALEAFRVQSPRSPVIRWDRVLPDLEEALAGRLALAARLAERAQRETPLGRSRPSTAGEPSVTVDNGISPTATVVEVHAPDSIGLLWRLARALAELDLDVRSAKVQTLGDAVVDSFYVRDARGGKVVDAQHLVETERALLHALGRT